MCHLLMEHTHTHRFTYNFTAHLQLICPMTIGCQQALYSLLGGTAFDRPLLPSAQQQQRQQ